MLHRAAAIFAVFMIAGACLAQDAVKESPIPKEHEAAARKAFAAKKVVYIWVTRKSCARDDFSFSYAINPEFKSNGAFDIDSIGTRVRLVRVVNGQRVPFAGIDYSKFGFKFNPHLFTGKLPVTIDIVKPLPDGVTPDKATPVSNEAMIIVDFGKPE